MAMVEVRKGWRCVTLHGKTECLKHLPLPAFLDEKEGKSACTTHKTPSMMTILLPIMDLMKPGAH